MAARKRQCACAEWALDQQPAKADNLWYHGDALCSRPGFSIKGEPEDIGRDTALYAFRDRVAVDDSAEVSCAKQRIALIQPGDIPFLKIASLSSDGTFAVEAAISVDSDETTVLCVPCALDAVADTLIYTSDGDLYSAGGGILQDESTRIYVPTVVQNGRGVANLLVPRPQMAGESANLLTAFFAAAYTTDAENSVFWLPFGELDNSAFDVSLRDAAGTSRTYAIAAGGTVSPADTDGYRVTLDRANGRFWFLDGNGTIAPPPLRGTVENLRVEGSKAALTRNKLVGGCRVGRWFGTPGAVTDGGRLFVGGNPAASNVVCCSAVGNPFYFPADGVYALGRSGEAITAILPQDGDLLFFKEHALFGLKYGDATDEIPPILCLQEAIGCNCPGSLTELDGHLIWATGEGIIWRLDSVDRYGGCRLSRLSDGIDDKIADIRPSSWKTAVAGLVDGHYFCAVGGRGFLLSSPEKPVWYRWKWDEGGVIVAMVTHAGRTGFLFRNLGGQVLGCVLEGTTDGFPLLGTPVEVSLDTGLLCDGPDKKRFLQWRLTTGTPLRVVPYTDAGALPSRMLLPTEERLPLRTAGAHGTGLRVDTEAPLCIKKGRVYYQMWHI